MSIKKRQAPTNATFNIANTFQYADLIYEHNIDLLLL